MLNMNMTLVAFLLACLVCVIHAHSLHASSVPETENPSLIITSINDAADSSLVSASPTPGLRREIAEGSVSPTSGTGSSSSSTSFEAKTDMAVSGFGTGGVKLARSAYGSDEEYIAACQASCAADAACKGFVDDPTDNRGRKCKPKSSSAGYTKPGKTLYVKKTPMCPREPGYCVKPNGDDQNRGVTKINDLNNGT